MTIHPIRSRPLVAIALVAALVAACAGAPGSDAPSTTADAPASTAATGAPTSDAPPTATPSLDPSPTAGQSLATSGRIEVPDKGFAVTLPDGWTRIDLSSGDLEAILEAAGALSPDLAALQSEQIKDLVKSGLVVFAFGPDPSAGTNLNIMSMPSGGLSLGLLEQLNKTQIDQLANGDVTVERVDLPAGEAVHFAYALPGADGPGPTIDQYLLLIGDQQVILSVTFGEANDARAIAESVEALD